MSRIRGSARWSARRIRDPPSSDNREVGLPENAHRVSVSGTAALTGGTRRVAVATPALPQAGRERPDAVIPSTGGGLVGRPEAPEAWSAASPGRDLLSLTSSPAFRTLWCLCWFVGAAIAGRVKQRSLGFACRCGTLKLIVESLCSP